MVFPGLPKANLTQGAVNTSEVMGIISEWVGECIGGHDACHLAERTELPKRVVKFTKSPEALRCDSTRQRKENLPSTPALVIAGSIRAHRYDQEPDTLSGFANDIPWAQLPATFQDAIVVASELGLEYIWIDSLCIIQDDDDNWEDQASKMATVYAGSFLTIAATGSPDGNGGCFTRTPVQTHLLRLQQGDPPIRTDAVFARQS